MSEQRFQIGQRVYAHMDNWAWLAVIREYHPEGPDGSGYEPHYRVEFLDEPEKYAGKLMWFGTNQLIREDEAK